MDSTTISVIIIFVLVIGYLVYFNQNNTDNDILDEQEYMDNKEVDNTQESSDVQQSVNISPGLPDTRLNLQKTEKESDSKDERCNYLRPMQVFRQFKDPTISTLLSVNPIYSAGTKLKI